MKCARCSAEIPAQSRFCLRCGTPIQAPPPPTATTSGVSAFPAAPRSNRPLIITVAALVFALLGLAAFVLPKLMQKPDKDAGGQLVQAPGTGSAGSLVQAPGNPRSGAPVQAPADTPSNKVVQNPAPTVNVAEINDYLAFLGNIERQRKGLMTDGNSKLTSLLAQVLLYSTSGASEESPDRIMNLISKTGSDLTDGWEDLAKQFSSYNKPIPGSCVQLHRAYNEMLGKQEQVFVAFKSDLGKTQPQAGDISSSVNALNRLKDVSSPEIDRARDTANEILAGVCRKYDMQKPFDISDPSSSISMPVGAPVH